MTSLLERLVELEGDVRYREPPGDDASQFGFVSGTTPVLLSAPHGAVHERRGTVKEEEEFTAGLACLVSEMMDAHALYLRRRSSGDPNWYRNDPYKRRLQEIVEGHRIRFVIDIHGSSPTRPFGIALGTRQRASCPKQRDEILHTLAACGFRVDAAFPDRLDVDEAFTGRGVDGQETITGFVSSRLELPAAQFELHPLLRVVERREEATLPRPFHGDPERIERVVKALVLLVGSFATLPASATVGDRSAVVRGAEPGVRSRRGRRARRSEATDA